MFTIEGKHGTAACYAINIENACIEQIRGMLDMPFAEGANTAIMPDAHYGLGCTIGTTMKVTDAVVPNLVGVDIGCGMLTADLGHRSIDLPSFDPTSLPRTSSARSPRQLTSSTSCVRFTISRHRNPCAHGHGMRG